MDNSFGVLEAEIVELQKKIEEKKNLLETKGGIIEERSLVSEAVSDLFSGASSPNLAVASSSGARTDDNKASYLDHLDNQTAETVTSLIEKMPQVGIAKVVAEAQMGNPYLIDALHDALVDKLYEELVTRGFILNK